MTENTFKHPQLLKYQTKLLNEENINLHELQHQYTGKLLIRKEIPLDEQTLQGLLKYSYLTTIQAIKRSKFKDECQRCGNKKRSLFAEIPCYKSGNRKLYCRNCIQMGRVMECDLLYFWSGPKVGWPKIENACTWNGTLTEAQLKAAKQIKSAVKSQDAELLIWAVCGAGKTEMLFSGITESLRLGKRICIATPRSDVVRELLPRFRNAFSNIEIQGLYGGSKEKDTTAQIIIATTHQLIRFKEAFDLLVIDEIDAFPYHADPSLPFVTERARKVISTTIYLTATPRKEQQHLIQRKKLLHLFVPIRYHGYALPIPQCKMCFSLKKDLQQSVPPLSFIKWLNSRENKQKQLLIFVPTIRLAECMEVTLQKVLMKNKIINKESALQFVHADDEKREEKVALFRQGKVSILITTTILERGVTFPTIDVVILDAGHIVFDEAALVQISGRAGRSPVDPTGDVMFFHDGKTDAMVQAIDSIKKMNKRAGF